MAQSIEGLPEINLFLVAESDFDAIIRNAGGTRIDVSQTQVSGESQADYRLGKSIIELKLIDDEGLLKDQRQVRLAELFEPTQADQPVVVIDESFLEPLQQQKYFRILETPFKTHIKKASKQLQATASKLGHDYVKVLLLFNNGYTALSEKQFEAIALNRVRNDTSQIDCVITAGLYHYGDGFDYYILSPFVLHTINIGKNWDGFDNLQKAWGDWLNEQLTLLIKDPTRLSLTKLRVQDLAFDFAGKTYVKPATKIGSESDFYVNGRPRKNTTGIETCPIVATILPRLSFSDWQEARQLFGWLDLKDNYKDYVSWADEVEKRDSTIRKIIVPFTVTLNDFLRSKKGQQEPTFHDLSSFATDAFNILIKEVVSKAISEDETTVLPVRYLHLTTVEIGQDLSFDMSTLENVTDSIAGSVRRPVFTNERIFFMYALLLTAAYAIKLDCPTIVYSVDKRFGWE